MSVLKSVLSPVLSSVLSSVLGDSVVQRYFTPLDSAFQQYYEIPTVTLTGDYKISAWVYFTGVDITVTGNNVSFNSRWKILANGNVLWKASDASGTEVQAGAASVPLNKFSFLEVERLGNNGTIKINGDTLFDGIVPTSSAIVDTICKNATSFSTGIPSDVKIHDVGTLTRWYKLNKNLALTNIILDSSGNGIDGTAVNITSSDFYTLNSAGTVWTSPGNPDLEIAYPEEMMMMINEFELGDDFELTEEFELK